MSRLCLVAVPFVLIALTLSWAPRPLVDAQDEPEKDALIPVLSHDDAELRHLFALCQVARTKSALRESLADPQFDPEKAKAAAQALADVRRMLDVMGPATEDAMRHFAQYHVERANEALKTGGRLADVQDAIFWQEVALAVADVAWDVAGVVGALQKVTSLIKGAKSDDELLDALLRHPQWGGQDLKANELWRKVNAAADTANTLVKRANEAQQDGLGDGYIGKDTLNSMISVHDNLVAVSDLIQKTYEARRLGTKVLTRANITAVIEPLFVVAKGFAERAKAELKEREQELQKNLGAEDKLLGDSWLNRTRMGRRFDLHNEADPMVEDAWLDLLRAFELAPTVGAKPPEVDEAVRGYKPPPGYSTRWAHLFKVYVPELARRVKAADDALAALNIEPGAEPAMSTDKRDYRIGEEITVTYDASHGVAEGGWIGLLDSKVPHGGESNNAREKLTLQSIPTPEVGKRVSGTMTFTAPDKPGLYDFRMCNSRINREYRSAPITVTSNIDRGLRLRFAAGMRTDADDPTVVRFNTKPGQFDDFLVFMVVEHETDGAQGGHKVDVRILDAGGEETASGPRIRGRWGLLSNYLGAVEGRTGKPPALWEVPPGKWTFEFSSPTVPGSLKVICESVEPPRALGVEFYISTQEHSCGWKDWQKRTLFGWGRITGIGPKQFLEKYRLCANQFTRGGTYAWMRINKMLHGDELAKQEYVEISVSPKTGSFFYSFTLDEGVSGNLAPGVTVFPKGSGAPGVRANRKLVALDIKDGMGELEVTHTDAWGNTMHGHWRILRDGEELWMPRPFANSPPALKIGPVDIERENAFIAGHKAGIRDLEVLEGVRRRVAIQSQWGIVHVLAYDKNGQLDGSVCDAVLYRSPYKKDDAPLCKLSWWGEPKINTPYGQTVGCLRAELPAGAYDLCISSKDGKNVVWKRVTIGPRSYIEYSFQGG